MAMDIIDNQTGDGSDPTRPQSQTVTVQARAPITPRKPRRAFHRHGATALGLTVGGLTISSTPRGSALKKSRSLKGSMDMGLMLQDPRGRRRVKSSRSVFMTPQPGFPLFFFSLKFPLHIKSNKNTQRLVEK